MLYSSSSRTTAAATQQQPEQQQQQNLHSNRLLNKHRAPHSPQSQPTPPTPAGRQVQGAPHLLCQQDGPPGGGLLQHGGHGDQEPGGHPRGDPAAHRQRGPVQGALRCVLCCVRCAVLCMLVPCCARCTALHVQLLHVQLAFRHGNVNFTDMTTGITVAQAHQGENKLVDICLRLDHRAPLSIYFVFMRSPPIPPQPTQSAPNAPPTHPQCARRASSTWCP